MPLHCQHEMIGSSSFERFDDAVIGAAGDDAEAVADYVWTTFYGHKSQATDIEAGAKIFAPASE